MSLIMASLLITGCATSYQEKCSTVQNTVKQKIEFGTRIVPDSRVAGGHYTLATNQQGGILHSPSGEKIVLCETHTNYFPRASSEARSSSTSLGLYTQLVWVKMSPAGERNRLNRGGCYARASEIKRISTGWVHENCGNPVVEMGTPFVPTTTVVTNQLVCVQQQTLASSGGRSVGYRSGSSSGGRSSGNGGAPGGGTTGGSRSDGNGSAPASSGGRSDGNGRTGG